jgi:hypothetical protein
MNLAEAVATLAHEPDQPLIAIVGYDAARLRRLESDVADNSELCVAMERLGAQAVGPIFRTVFRHSTAGATAILAEHAIAWAPGCGGPAMPHTRQRKCRLQPLSTVLPNRTAPMQTSS